jgi:hypothetical protein
MDDLAEQFDPCRRSAYPELRPMKDLYTDKELTEAVLCIADSFFALNHTYAIYSGFAREADERDGSGALLYAQVWVDGKLRRSVAFRDSGYVGILHIEVANEFGFEFTLGQDLIGTLYGRGENPERVVAIVSGGRMEISYEVRR